MNNFVMQISIKYSGFFLNRDEFGSNCTQSKTIQGFKQVQA